MSRQSQSSKTIVPGTFRQFGPFGPVYKILRATTRQNDRGEPLFVIEVPESGERVHYSSARIFADPEVR